MLGIFLIYWIGKKYYDLATIHGRSPWGFAILAIAIYYGSQFIIGIILAIAWPSLFENLKSFEETILNITFIPVSLGVWYLVFMYLRKKWEGQENIKIDDYDSQIEQIGKED